MAKTNEPLTQNSICGIVMPISEIDGCKPEHWKDVYQIISTSIREAGFSPRMVSESDDSGIIQRRIIQNLYEDPIVVVDVSGKNPNVMFELGLRLAFDKPTIVIKDDQTDYSFDTSPLEHLGYPRDLRFQTILEFQHRLRDKIIGTYKSSTNDKDYTTFLKHFGTFKIAKLDEKTVDKDDYIMKNLEALREEVRKFSSKEIKLPSENRTSSIVLENRMREFAMHKGLKSLGELDDKKSEALFLDCVTYVRKFKDVGVRFPIPHDMVKEMKEIINYDLPF